jgi:hypothetical protein
MQFARAVQALCDSRVDFVVIGGLSATFHGSARVTFDLDICYSRAGANLRRLVHALANFSPRPRDFPHDLPFVWDEATLRNTSVLTLQTTIGEIDLLAEVAGLGNYDAVRQHSVFVEAFDRKIATLDLPGLIASKRAAGRAKDLAALPELESILEAQEHD